MNPREILSQMTLEEKAILLTGKRNWWFHGVPRLGIRDFVCGDGPHGIRAYKDLSEHGGHPKTRMPATMFPSASAMAATFNTDLVHQVGEVIGKECNHYNVDVILAPGVNGKRSPLGGRNFEYYSEDPVLTANMGIAFVRGVQSQGVGTSLKHFVLNEQENLRRFLSSQVDERVFRELYAYPFEQIVKKAKPLTIMASYNKINFEYACENKPLLTDLLRKQWGYQGIVISDWGGVQNKEKSVLSGMDIEMPESEWKDPFIRDVLNGKYDVSIIDEAVLRILTAYEWMLKNSNHGKKTDFELNHQIAKSVANEAIVLLKNEAVLPLKSTDKILLLGEFEDEMRINGGGSSELMPYRVDGVSSEIEAIAKVTKQTGYSWSTAIESLVKKADKVVVFVGTTPQIESEGHDRKNLSLPSEQLNFIQHVVNFHKQVIVVNSSGSAVDFEPFINQIQGLIQAWFLGSATGSAIANILFGVVNPSGKLSETFPLQLSHVSSYPQFPGTGIQTEYTEGLLTGYRHFDTHDLAVRFPFGFGLSYTTFDISEVELSCAILSKSQSIQIRANVMNTGYLAGKETVQLYFGYPQTEFIHPKKVLKKFVKIDLLPGESKTVVFELSTEDFQTYSKDKKAFLVQEGIYEIYIGNSVNNVLKPLNLHVFSDDVLHLPKQLDYPVNVWLLLDPEKTVLERLLQEYRPLYWWEREEPLDRVLKRLVSEKGQGIEKYEECVRSLDISVGKY